MEKSNLEVRVNGTVSVTETHVNATKFRKRGSPSEDIYHVIIC